MSKMYSKSLMDELKDSKGYDLALLTTYNIDIHFFDNRIKSVLLSNGIKNISLFVDLKKLNQSIQNEKNSDMGRQYSVFPMDIHGAFHPKVILLLGKEKAKLFVSSANLKVSSYRYNNEVFNCFGYTAENNENGEMIENAIRFFINLQDIAVQQLYSDDPKHEIKDTFVYSYLNSYRVNKPDNNVNCFFIDNSKETIIDQVQRIVGSKINKISISSPFFDNDLKAVKNISERFGCDNIEVYIQNSLNRFPVDYNRKYDIVPQTRIHVFNELIDGDRYFYHGKVIELSGEDNDYILFGSSNCTANALLKTYNTDGNIEASVLCMGNRKEYDYFFNSFVLNPGLQLESNFSIEETEDDTGFSFLYGLVKNESIYLFIRSNTELNNLVVKYQDKTLKRTIDKRYLLVELPISQFESKNSIFPVVLFNDGKEYSISCWFLDFKEIRYFRTNTSIDSSLKYTYSDDDDDRYYEFVMSVNRIIASKTDSNSSWLYRKSSASNNDEDYAEGDEEYEYVIDDPMADLSDGENEYYYFRKGLRSVAANYYSRLLKIHNEKPHEKAGETTGENNTNNEKKKGSDGVGEYSPLSGMNKLGRYIKRLTRNYLSDVTSSRIPSDVFLDLSGLVLNTIQREYYDKKYRIKENEKKTDDFLNLNEVLEIRHTISKSMVDLPADNFEDIEIRTVISVVLDYIAEMGHYYQNQRKEDPYGDVKNILIKLDKKFGIRERIGELIDSIELTVENMTNAFGYNPKIYVDELFGYKTGSQLESEFITRYGKENVSIEDEGKWFSINIHVSDLNKNKSIPIKLITNIIDSLYETDKNFSRIKVTYRNKSNQVIEYNIEFVKKAKYINRVIQKSNINGETIIRECRRLSTVYAPGVSFD